MALNPQQEEELLLKVRDMHAVFIGSPEVPGKFMELSLEVEKQDGRIRVTERFQWVLTGVGMVLGYLIYHLADLVKTAMAVGKIAGTTAFLHSFNMFRSF